MLFHTFNTKCTSQGSICDIPNGCSRIISESNKKLSWNNGKVTFVIQDFLYMLGGHYSFLGITGQVKTSDGIHSIRNHTSLKADLMQPGHYKFSGPDVC